MGRGTLLIGRTIYTVRAVESDDAHWNVSVGDFHARLPGVVTAEPALGAQVLTHMMHTFNE